MPRCLLALAVAAALPAAAPAQPLPQRVFGAIFGGAQPAPEPGESYGPADAAKADAEALRAARLDPAEPKQLLDYFRSRTLSATDAGRIDAAIRRLGVESFEERLKAMDEVEKFGPAAVAPLRKASVIDAAAVNSADFEVAYRAGEVLKRLEKVPHARVALAAAKALAKVPRPETARVLLDYLPQADDAATAEAVVATLTALAEVDGKPDAALVAALTAPSPARRTLAARALIEGGRLQDGARVPAAADRVRAAAKAEADPDAKFDMNHALAVAARDKDAVTALIPLIPDVTRGRVWQAEDLLTFLAGDAAPDATFGGTRPALAKAAAAWAGWWGKGRDGIDLAKAAYKPRVLGRTLLVVMDPRNGGGYVAELGADLKERWRIEDAANPYDAQVLPDGNVALAEMNVNSISVRDTSGRVLVQKSITGNAGRRIYGNPQQLQVLPNGDFFVVCRNIVLEMKRDKADQTVVYDRSNNYDVTAATRLPNGETAVLLQNPPNNIVFLDKEGKEIADRKFTTAQPYYQADIAAAGPGRILVTENQQVVEYDVATKKPVWTHKSPNARCVQRLPSGNTLIVEMNNSPDGSNRVVEVTKANEEVWSHRLGPGQMIFRAYRR